MPDLPLSGDHLAQAAVAAVCSSSLPTGRLVGVAAHELEQPEVRSTAAARVERSIAAARAERTAVAAAGHTAAVAVAGHTAAVAVAVAGHTAAAVVASAVVVLAGGLAGRCGRRHGRPGKRLPCGSCPT